MRANITLKMDRVIDPHRHYISPGGYEVIADGKSYQFDFMESCGSVSCDDKTIIAFCLSGEDKGAFPEIQELRERMNRINKLTECYIYTGEQDEPEINCLKILGFSIMDSGTGIKQAPESTPFIHVTHIQNKREWTTIYTFTERLLATLSTAQECGAV